MDDRWIVGMTEGAKKRGARILAVGLCVADARAAFRVGERLRPCRGCEDCDPRIAEALTAARSEYDASIEYDGPCGGSGVMVRWLVHLAGPALEARDVCAGESPFSTCTRTVEAPDEAGAWALAEALAEEIGEGQRVVSVEAA